MPDLIDDYQAQLVELTTDAEVALDDAYAQHVEGNITAREAADVMALVAMLTAWRASSLAEVTAAAWLSRMDGVDVLPVGIAPVQLLAPDYRLSASFERTITARDGVTKIHQTMRAATYDSASDTLTTFIAHKAPNKKWRRRTEGTNCKVCNGLAAEGREFLMTTPMKRHTGCRCFPQPVN